MAEKRIEKVKYVALYRGAPMSAITHYAKVLNISAPNEDGKRVISLDEPIELPQKIILGDTSIMNVRRLSYVKLDALKSSITVAQLQQNVNQ